MASTKTIKTAPYGSGRYLQLDCTQTKDIANNESTITWKLTSTGGESNYFSTGPTTVTINGTQVYYKERLYYKDGSSLPFPGAKGSVSGTIKIKHDDYGNKTISVSLSTAIYTSTVSTYSDSWTLDSIPRQATWVSVPNFTDLDTPTITYSNLAGNAVDELVAGIFVDNSTYVVPYKSISKTGASNDNITYQFPITDAERDAIRNAITTPSRTMYFYIRTKIGDTYYWDDEPFTLSIKETENTKPIVSTSITLNNGSLPSQFDGMYIQNKSRVDVTITAQGKYNASINSVYAEIDGQRLDSLTFNILKSPGDVNIVGYAKDSRGSTNFDTKTVNVLEYSKPLVKPLGDEKAIRCYRSDGIGNKASNSASIWVKASRSYSPLISSDVQKNFCALQYRYKLSTESWNDSTHKWKDLIPKTDTTTNDYNALIPGETFNKQTSYTIQIRVIDDVGGYDIKPFDIPTDDVTLHLRNGGRGVGIGKYSETEDLLDVGYSARFHKDINNTYIKSKYITGSEIVIQSCCDNFDISSTVKQSIFMFGSLNRYDKFYGLLSIWGDGSVDFNGSNNNITYTTNAETGKVYVELPNVAYAMITFISGNEFDIE